MPIACVHFINYFISVLYQAQGKANDGSKKMVVVVAITVTAIVLILLTLMLIWWRRKFEVRGNLL